MVPDRWHPKIKYDAALIGARPDDRAGRAFDQRQRSASEQGFFVSVLAAGWEQFGGCVGHHFGLTPL